MAGMTIGPRQREAKVAKVEPEEPALVELLRRAVKRGLEAARQREFETRPAAMGGGRKGGSLVSR